MSLPTKSGAPLKAGVSLKQYGALGAVLGVMKVAPKNVAIALGREGIRNFVPLAGEAEDFLSHFGDPMEIATIQAALLYLRVAAWQSLRAIGVEIAAMSAAVAEALAAFGSRLTMPMLFIRFDSDKVPMA